MMVGLRALSVVLLGWFVACASIGHPERGEGGSLRGRVAIVGSDPTSLVVLRTPELGDVVLRGDPLPALRNLSGLEIEVTGSRGTRVEMGASYFVVTGFRVLALDGVPAVDGLLEEEEGGFYLRSSGGERIQLALAGIPGALVSHIGDHIWVAGDLDRGIEAFGLIWSGGFWGDSR